ncbi:hypothetical protein BDW62DRAFT_197320 [Aspergillus aurantiobrunneus]
MSSHHDSGERELPIRGHAEQPELRIRGRAEAARYPVIAQGLRARAGTRRVGGGTSPVDPLIIWLCSPPNDEDRMEGIDNVCREAGSHTGSTIVWVRMIDHRTTQITSGSGRGRARVVRAQPHITV